MDEFATGYLAGQNDNNNNSGFFGNESWMWIIVIFALLFGWGGNGWGNAGFGGGYAAQAAGIVTNADLQRGFDTNTIINKLNGLENGLCDGFYSMNTGMLNGFHGVDNAVCTLGYQNAQLINGLENTITQTATANHNALATQLNNMAATEAACCCETQRQIERGFCDVNYNLATQTRDIVDSQNAGTRAILDAIKQQQIDAMQDKINTLTADNQTLRFAASQAAQNTLLTDRMCDQTARVIQAVAPTPVPAYPVPAPYPYCVPQNQGCGCSYAFQR